MSAANKKHYEALTWDGFFDELSYADDVLCIIFRALLCSGLGMKVVFSFASTGQAIQL